MDRFITLWFTNRTESPEDLVNITTSPSPITVFSTLPLYTAVYFLQQQHRRARGNIFLLSAALQKTKCSPDELPLREGSSF